MPSACKTPGHRCVAVRGIVPDAAIVPVLLAGAYQTGTMKGPLLLLLLYVRGAHLEGVRVDI